MNDKYVVVKADAIDWKGSGDGEFPRWGRITEDDVIEDAVVIRRQDVFAAPALHAYANAIAVAVRAIEETAESSHTAKQTAYRLQEIADYFHEQSELASDPTASGSKLPD